MTHPPKEGGGVEKMNKIIKMGERVHVALNGRKRARPFFSVGALF